MAMKRRKSSWFKDAPKQDRAVRLFVPKANFLHGPVQNGFFQHIAWCGVATLAIINHFHREILLVDPWPSHTKSHLLRASVHRKDQARLVYFANWLREICGSSGYSIVGLLVSHDHFDHADDVPKLLELLTAPPGSRDEGWYPRKSHLEERTLRGPRIAPNLLPRVICDADTLTYLEGLRGRRPSKLKLVEGEMGTVRLSEDHAKDVSGPLVAGTALKPIRAGEFNIRPYVWDHANNACGHTGPRQLSGNWQRQLAFRVEKRGVASARSTFIIPSAGEMGPVGAGGAKYVTHQKPNQIKADILFQGIPVRVPIIGPTYEARVKELIAYHAQNMDIRDCIVPIHWDPFVTGEKGDLAKARKKTVGEFVSRVKREEVADRVLYAAGKPNESNKIAAIPRLMFDRTKNSRIPARTDMAWPDKL